MLIDSLELHYKYKFVKNVLSQDHMILFKTTNEIDFDLFFIYYDSVISMYRNISSSWISYSRKRLRLIKTFEYKKYEILLRNYFCNDIKHIVLSFLF